jgi:hypothetical protein
MARSCRRKAASTLGLDLEHAGRGGKKGASKVNLEGGVERIVTW